MRSFFITRQYPVAIDRATHMAFSIDHTTAFTRKTCAANECIQFTIRFHPINSSLKLIVYHNFNLLRSASNTLNIFIHRLLLLKTATILVLF